jgi:hypothetical protein
MMRLRMSKIWPSIRQRLTPTPAKK